jgi:hypothetical protein
MVAVDHVTGGRGRAGHEVVALHEHDVDALQGEVAEGAESVDAAADDDDLRVRAVAELLDLGAGIRIGRHV